MKNKVAFIIPYFGKLPNFACFFFESTKHNFDFDFIFFTDIDTILETKNVFVNKMQFSEFKQLASKKMELDIHFTSAYKLCEFKPVYGKIFEDYIPEYSFWGVCDIDLILGRLTHFITDELLDKIDVYSGVSYYLSGSFFLFRNTPQLNLLYEKSIDYKQIFENEEYRFFDECGPVWHELAQGNSIEEVHAGIDSITHVIRRQEKEGKLKTYFADSILERTGDNSVLIKKGAIIMAEKEYLTLHFIYLKTTYHFFVPNWNPIPINYFVDTLGFHPMSSLSGLRYLTDGSVANKVRNKFNNIIKRVVKLNFKPSSHKIR